MNNESPKRPKWDVFPSYSTQQITGFVMMGIGAGSLVVGLDKNIDRLPFVSAVTALIGAIGYLHAGIVLNKNKK